MKKTENAACMQQTSKSKAENARLVEELDKKKEMEVLLKEKSRMCESLNAEVGYLLNDKRFHCQFLCTPNNSFPL